VPACEKEKNEKNENNKNQKSLTMDMRAAGAVSPSFLILVFPVT
jgi:hypothetical protein